MKRKTPIRQILFVIGVLLFLVSCSTYQNKLEGPRADLKSGRVTEALDALKKLAENSGDDQLVYLMEYGTALQIAGDYKESNRVFLQADRLADRVDYHSVSNITLATLGSEEMVQYKGESYEKLLINASVALNFVMLGQYDEALVEARRINEKINKIRLEGRPDYERNPFAHYLSALLWEADRKFDDAYIAFENAYKLDATNAFLPEDLIRSAKNARRDEAYKKWKKEFPQVKESPDWYDKNKGEIVVILEQGWGPRKDFAPGNRRMPKLYPVFSITQNVKATLTDHGKSVQTATSAPVYDVEQASIHTLDADYGWMVARKIGAFAAKEIVADQLRQKNELLGVIAWIGMHASDRADLRQWSTLPKTVQLARFWVPGGSYTLNLQGLDSAHALTADQKENIPITVKPGRKTFYFWRTLR